RRNMLGNVSSNGCASVAQIAFRSKNVAITGQIRHFSEMRNLAALLYLVSGSHYLRYFAKRGGSHDEPRQDGILLGQVCPGLSWRRGRPYYGRVGGQMRLTGDGRHCRTWAAADENSCTGNGRWAGNEALSPDPRSSEAGGSFRGKVQNRRFCPF